MVNKSAAKPATGQPVKTKAPKKKNKTPTPTLVEMQALEIADSLSSDLLDSVRKDRSPKLISYGSVDEILEQRNADLKPGGKPGNKNAEKWTEEVALALANDLIAWMNLDRANIFHDKFLVQIKNIHPGTIHYLKNKYVSFSILIKKAEKIKETKIWEYGILGKLNPAMAIFCLKNHHGATDRVEQKVEHSGSVSQDLSHLSVDELTKLLETATNE